MARRKNVPEFWLPLTPRRQTTDGLLLHCCVVCGILERWSDSWIWYGSYQEEDDGVPVQKFCSEKCKANQRAVTIEMSVEAREKEHLPVAA